MDIKTIYEDSDVLVVNKPAGIVVFEEQTGNGSTRLSRPTLINELIKEYPELKNAGEVPRYGAVHRLDKDTSGVLLVAKTTEALIFLQKQFKNREVGKIYICLVEGEVKNDSGEIKTLVARSSRDPRKQTVYPLDISSLPAGRQAKSAREAITEYKTLQRYNGFTLLEVKIKTGRRHQIRCHFSYLQHPVAGDKLYNFKKNHTGNRHGLKSKNPEGLTRQFLHAKYLKIQLPNGEIKEFQSDLPEELENILKKLKK
jgi:23S rRNA pseudouridine1911/1915/1917 synthase